MKIKVTGRLESVDSSKGKLRCGLGPGQSMSITIPGQYIPTFVKLTGRPISISINIADPARPMSSDHETYSGHEGQWNFVASQAQEDAYEGDGFNQ